MNLSEKLRSKGWSDRELSHLKEHFSPRKEHYVLVVAGLLLLAFAVAGVPYAYGLLGQVLTDAVFYVTIVLVGLPLGAAFGILFVDLDRLDRGHHVFLLVAIPLVVLGVATWLFARANAQAPAGTFTHNALIGALVYAFSFIAPYALLVKQEWNYRIGPLRT